MLRIGKLSRSQREPPITEANTGASRVATIFASKATDEVVLRTDMHPDVRIRVPQAVRAPIAVIWFP